MILEWISRKSHRLGQVASNPRLLALRRKGVNLEDYIRLNQPWLKGAKIQTVIDIGANVGQFASLIREVLPHAKVYAFEPVPNCYEQLMKERARIGNLEPINVALGDKVEECEFHENHFNPSSSLLPMSDLHKMNYPHAARDRVIKVKVARLADIAVGLDLSRKILIKIDVQGYEHRVIKGGRRTLDQASILVIETSFRPLYVGQALFEDIYQLLHDRFRYVGSLGGPVLSKLDGEALFQDSIFVAKKDT